MNWATNSPSDLTAESIAPPLHEIGEAAHPPDLGQPEARPIRWRQPEQRQDLHHRHLEPPSLADARMHADRAVARRVRDALLGSQGKPPLALVGKLSEQGRRFSPAGSVHLLLAPFQSAFCRGEGTPRVAAQRNVLGSRGPVECSRVLQRI
jgi:hypothetical protein